MTKSRTSSPSQTKYSQKKEKKKIEEENVQICHILSQQEKVYFQLGKLSVSWAPIQLYKNTPTSTAWDSSYNEGECVTPVYIDRIHYAHVTEAGNGILPM